MGSTRHLVTRFFGSLWPGGPRAGADRWARAHLLPAEVALWTSMPGRDRRHAVSVARRAATALGEAPRPVVAAALLHDVGKADSRLGVGLRVLATLIRASFGRARAERWSQRPGAAGRVGRYLRHPELGAEMLALAGSDPLTVRWAAQHHRPEEAWEQIPVEVGRALRDADDD